MKTVIAQNVIVKIVQKVIVLATIVTAKNAVAAIKNKVKKVGERSTFLTLLVNFETE